MNSSAYGVDFRGTITARHIYITRAHIGTEEKTAEDGRTGYYTTSIYTSHSSEQFAIFLNCATRSAFIHGASGKQYCWNFKQSVCSTGFTKQIAIYPRTRFQWGTLTHISGQSEETGFRRFHCLPRVGCIRFRSSLCTWNRRRCELRKHKAFRHTKSWVSLAMNAACFMYYLQISWMLSLSSWLFHQFFQDFIFYLISVRAILWEPSRFNLGDVRRHGLHQEGVSFDEGLDEFWSVAVP